MLGYVLLWLFDYRNLYNVIAIATFELTIYAAFNLSWIKTEI
jgi:hypothetical protein